MESHDIQYATFLVPLTATTIIASEAGLEENEMLEKSQAQAGDLQDVSLLTRGISFTAPE